MKKTYQWKWNGRFIPIQKLHYNQLFSILKSLNSDYIKNSGSISKFEWQKAIKDELEFRSKKDTNEVIKFISKRYESRAKQTVNQLVKQFSNAKIF